MAFEKIDIPLAVGIRDDLTTLDLSAPGLATAENVIFEKTGEITGRPCLASENMAVVTHSGTDSSVVGDLSLVLNDRLGLCGDDERLLLIEAGSAMAKTAVSWDQTGSCWSVKVAKAPLVGDFFTGVAAFSPHAGATIVGFPTTAPVGNYSTPSGLPAASGAEIQRWAIGESRCVAGDTLFVTNTGSLYMIFGYPVETTVTLATNAFLSGAVDAPQKLWATTHSAGFYVVYQLAGTAGIRVCDVNAAGTVVNALIITKGQTVSGNALLALGLAVDAATNDIILAVAGIDNSLATYRVAGLTMTDTGHDSTFITALNERVRGPVVGCTGGGDAFVAAYTEEIIPALGGGTVGGDVIIFRRASNAALPPLTPHRTLHGDPLAPFFPGIPRWRTWFPPQIFAGQMVMGVYHLTEATQGLTELTRGATWAVVDITSSQKTPPIACGVEGEALATTVPSSAHVTAEGALAVAFLEGTRFDLNGVHAARARRLSIASTPPQSCTVNGLTHLSGQLGYVFDGKRTYEAGWPIAPSIRCDLKAGGALGVGTRTFSACWAYTDAQGNIHRSAPASKKTVTVTPGSQQVEIRVSLPQLTARPRTGISLEVYMSVADPFTGADLFRWESNTITIPTLDAPSQIVTVFDEPGGGLTAQEALYTGGGILANERPLANSGIALVGGRLWCAEGQKAYASKFLRDGAAPAWAVANDSLTLTVPSGYGEIRGIGGLDNLLVLFCANAVLVFTGQGPGDAGGPSDFSEPRQVYRAAGPARPCDVVNGRDALVWVTDGGDAHTFGQGSTGKQFSRPVGNLGLKKPTFLPGSRTDHDAIIFSTDNPNTLAVMDTDMAQWVTWVAHAPVLDIYANRDGAHALFEVDPYVGSYTQKGQQVDQTSPQFVPIATLKTRLLPLGYLGRVKSIKPLGTVMDAGTEMTLSVYSDRAQQVIPGNTKTFDISAATERWPREELPEMRLSVQRMESFAVAVTFIPGTVRLRALQVQIKRETGNPRNQRK